MTLLNAALAIAGLCCIAIPIIIHLLMNRRRKPVMWGAMRFLVEAYKRQQRRLILEKWLLLAARCLLVALLALALGKPLIGALMGGGGGYNVFVLIDNGLASQAKTPGEPSSLERHKASAKALIASLRDRAAQLGGEPNRVGLIALAGPAEGLVMPPSTDLAAVSALIDALPAEDSRSDIPGALSLVAAALGASGADAAPHPISPQRTLVVVLSDFSEGSLDLSATGDTLGATRLPDGVRLLVSEPARPGQQGSPQTNVSIAGVEPLRSVLLGSESEGADQVRVLLHRSGAGIDQAQATIVRADLRVLDAAGTLVGTGSSDSIGERTTVRWSPGQDSATANVTLAVDPQTARAVRTTTGPTGVIVASIDSDAIPGDNRWIRPVNIRSALKIGVVAPSQFGRLERADKLDPGAWVRLALAPAGEGGEIEIADIEPASLDAGRLLGLDALILPRPDAVPESSWARIRTFVDAGGMVLITPPPNVTVHLWADAMSQTLGVNWSLAREAKPVPDSRVLRAKLASTDPASPSSAAAGVLSFIEGELDELLKPVVVRRVLPIVGAPDTGASILTLQDGTPLLWIGSPEQRSDTHRAGDAGQTTAGRGLVAYLAVALDLDWTDLPAKPLMVPLVQELVRQGVGHARGSWWSVAGTHPPAPPRTQELIPITAFSASDPAARAPTESASLRVDALGLSTTPVRASAVYRAFDAAGVGRGLLAVNADARAGRLGAQEREAVGGWLRTAFGLSGPATPATDPVTWISPDGPGAVATPAAGSQARVVSLKNALPTLLGASDRGSPFWFPLLVGVLLVAVFELWLARRASHAQISGSAPASLGGEPAPALAPAPRGEA